MALIAESTFFDAADYLRLYPDVAASGMAPLEHYVMHGAAEGRSPGCAFDAAHYVSEHPEAEGAALRHYLQNGRHQDFRPRPLVDQEVSAIEAHGIFDSAWYLERYPSVASGADCASLGSHLGAISHYVKYGAAENRWPCRAFDTGYYKKTYKDVAASGINPLLHYCDFGWKELRDPSAAFDAFAYVMLYLDCDFKAINPLKHFLGLHARGADAPPAAVAAKSLNADEIESAFVKHPAGTRIGARTALVAARWFIERKKWAGAEVAYEVFFGQAEPHSIHYREFARVLSARGQLLRALAAFRSASSLEPLNADLHFRIGQILETMGDFAGAAASFAEAAELDPGSAARRYELGYALQRCGDQSAATKAYARAIAIGSATRSAGLGIGAFHEGAQRWQDAAEAYRTRIRKRPGDAELHYRLGFALDHCYAWEEAVEAYRTAISLRFGEAAWHYRYAYVLERLQRWSQAADAYAACHLLDTGNKMPDAVVRQGHVLAKAGDYERACAVYLTAWPASDRQGWPPSEAVPVAPNAGRTSPPADERFDQRAYRQQFDSQGALMEAIARSPLESGLYADLGEVHEASGRVDDAIDAYRQALARLEEDRPDVHYRLGRALTAAGDFKAAAEAFAGIMVFRSPMSVELKSLKLSPMYTEIAEYCDFRENLPVSPDVILYESYGGVSMACNPYAIFRHIVDSSEFAGKLHVWVLNDKADADPAYVGRSNVVFVTRNSRLHRMYLATAGYLIHNSSFPALFVRRPGQRYLNTWHGTPLKTLGRDIKGNFMERRHSVRSRLQATHLINPNAHTTHALMDRCDIAGLFPGKVAETGYPRNDVLVHANEERQASARARLGIAGTAKIVLYAPTWRGILFHPEVKPDKLIADMAALVGLDCEVVFRGHYFAEQALKDSPIPVHVAPHSLDTADLLSITDVLITDYSSIFFDFLPTRRPILFYTYDLGQYVRERGLYFDMHAMPGPLCMEIVALRSALESVLNKDFTADEKYESAIVKFAPHEDGNATQRGVDFVFYDAYPALDTGERCRPSILVYAGDFDPADAEDRAAAACIERLAGHGDLTLLIDHDKIGGRSRNMELFDRLPASVRVIARIGARTGSAEERWLMGLYAKRPGTLSGPQMDVYAAAYRREYARLLGDCAFDFLLDLRANEPYWSSVLAFGDEPNKRILVDVRSDDHRKRERGASVGLEAYFEVVRVSPTRDDEAGLFEAIFPLLASDHAVIPGCGEVS